MKLGKLIGIGRTAEVYEFGIGKVIKLYFQGFEGAARYEYEKHFTIQLEDIPMPTIYSLEEYDGRLGIVYQQMFGKTMGDVMLTSDNPVPLIEKMADLHYDLKNVTGLTELPTYSSFLSDGLRHISRLTRMEVVRLNDRIASFQDGNSLIHGDYHPYNIMLNLNDFYIIDWNNASIGCFEADVANTIAVLEFGSMEAGIDREQVYSIISVYYDRMKQLGIDEALVNAWTPPVLAVKLNEGHPQITQDAIIKRLRELI